MFKLILLLPLLYYYRINAIFYIIKMQIFLEEKINLVKIYFQSPKTFYSLTDFRPYKDFQNEKMLLKIKHNNITKYMIVTSNIQPDYIRIANKRMFSSVILYTDKNMLDVTEIINCFCINGCVINFNSELVRISMFLKNIDYKTTSHKWGIITNTIDMYETENIIFKINDDKLIVYKE
tara:strand:+ start:913 stop:1446 length:534 start_codon:yes stop_codon:yes gene_type:complete